MRKMLIKLFATMCIVTLVFVACGGDDDSTDTTTTTTTTEAAQGQSLVEIAQANPEFSTLVRLVSEAGLAETLAGGEYTVFAPNNDAFDALPDGALEQIEGNAEALQAILTYHAIAGEVLNSSDLEDGAELTMANSLTLTVSISDDGIVSLTDNSGNTVNVIQADVEASNGVIHVIDGVLVPQGVL